MWRCRSESNLVEWQGHLSVWPLYQVKTTSEAPRWHLLSHRRLKNTQYEYMKTYFSEDKYLGVSICTLSLCLCQHIQLKIYVLLSLEWSLHASGMQPLANWKSHLLTSLAFSRQINGSMNQWEGMNRLRLRGNGLCIHTHSHPRTHTHQIFTIDMWLTLSIMAAKATQHGERNDFMSEKICSWIQLRLMVRDLDSLCSLVRAEPLTWDWLLIDQENYTEQLSLSWTG